MKLLILLLLASCASVKNEFQAGCFYGAVGLLRENTSVHKVINYCDEMERIYRSPHSVKPIPEPKRELRINI